MYVKRVRPIRAVDLTSYLHAVLFCIVDKFANLPPKCLSVFVFARDYNDKSSRQSRNIRKKSFLHDNIQKLI